MENNARNIIKNVVESADKYAINVAMARSFMMHYREMLKEEV